MSSLMPMMVAAVLAANTNVTMEFDGTLKEGLKQLAQKSGLNLVVIGEFDERVNLNFPGVDGETALETIAQAYGLEITRSGKEGAVQPNGTAMKMWVIRRASAPMTPPMIPGTPAPPVPVPLDPTATREAADAARRAADRAREQAEVLRAKAEAMRDSTEEAREKAREAAERAREEAEAMREKAEELREAVVEAKEQAREQAREAAEEAREQAREAAELARAQAQDAAEAERERLEALREQGLAQADLSRAQAELERHRVSTGGPVTVEKGSKVDTAVAYGGPVIVEEDAVVAGDAVAFGGDVVLKKGAVVQGHAVSFGGSVVREPGSDVQGESVSMGGTGIGSAVARGMVKTQRAQQREEAEEAGDHVRNDNGGRGLAFFLLKFAALFGLGFLLMMFAPQRMKALEASISTEPGKNGVAGVLGVLAAVPLSVMLVISLVGIPVVLVAIPAAVLLVLVGLAAIANTIGAKLPTGRMRKTQALVLAVGLFAMLIVSEIPILGGAALLVAALVSAGAIIRTRFGQNSRGTPMLDQMPTAPVL